MAHSIDARTDVTSPQVGVSSPVARFFLPSFSDLLFIAVLIWLFAAGSAGWLALLADGDTGWHIRTGEWVLQNGAVPRTDIFSFSRAGDAWFAWEWLSDVVFALLHQLAGLKALVLVTGIILTAAGTLLFRHMMWRGATPFAALVLALLAFGASTVHHLARPHMFTLFGMTAGLWLIDGDRRRHTPWVWALVPATAVWTNLHGGFLGLVACLGLLVVGETLEAGWKVWQDGAAWDLSRVKRYGLLAALCTAASLANPYGWNLHLHVFQYMRSDFIKDSVQEFQSPSFRTESMMQFEMVLLAALISVGWLLAQRQVTAVLWILFWAHNSLTSVRHVPIFMIVASPWVAMALTELWNRYLAAAPRASTRGILASLAQDMRPGCVRTSAWIGLVLLAFLVLPEKTMHWPSDFPDVKFPAKMTAKYSQKLLRGRVLTMDQWADYLIYHNYPKQRVFIDGRSDFYGKDLGGDYMKLMQGHSEWRKLLDKYGFDVVLSPNGWSLASLLKQSPEWRLVEDDGMALLFERTQKSGTNAPVPSAYSEPSSQKKALTISNENPRPGRT
ncbi:MAG: hypothetical protein JST93_06660 [Acidobacteria bacterium]|nr:hypothetical protein [Acidobacteriota bacterium]